MARRVVIDSSRLQSPELREFLGANTMNVAVLPDVAWFEVCKQQSVDALVAFLSVVGEFPEQIALLRSSSEIAKLNPALTNIEAMEQPDASKLMRDLIGIVSQPRREDPLVLAALDELWRVADTQLAGMNEGAVDIVMSLPEMAEQMFSGHELRIVRTNARYSDAMFSSIFGAAEQIWETLADAYDLPWRSMGRQQVLQAYLFRYALGLVIYLLWWIGSGSPKLERNDRVRNDLIDLSFAVYATYYDGFLTADRKAEWIYLNLSQALQAVSS